MSVFPRTAAEFASSHIDKALNIDVRNHDFASQAAGTLPRKATIAVYCRSGHRSKIAARILTEKGFKVIDLDTGFNGWTAAGKPVAK